MDSTDQGKKETTALKAAYRSMGPRMVIGIEPTKHCNLRCIHCLRDDTATFEELPIDFVESIFDQAQVYGRPHIAMTGGEPTLHRRFFDILELVRKYGYTCHFVTNGKTLGKLLPTLEGYKDILSYICFSIDGGTEYTHDTVRGKGSYQALRESVLLTFRYGFTATLQLVVNRLNRPELGRLPELCRHLGVRHLYISHAMPTVDLYEAGLQLHPNEWLEVEQEVRAISASSDSVMVSLSEGVFDPGTPAPCQALKMQTLNIDHAGRLTLCCLLSGVAGVNNVGDVICDLNTVSLREGHKMLVERVAETVSDRLDLFGRAEQDPLDGFQCWRCAKRFGKTGWMSRFPEDAWAQSAMAYKTEEPTS